MSAKKQTPQTETKIDWGVGEFTADGHKFKVMSRLSLERMITYYKHAPEFTYGLSWEKMYENNDKKMKFINDGKAGEAYHLMKIENEYIAKVKDPKIRYDATLLLASIFIVREDEDTKRFDYDFANKKIENWLAEGLDYTDFFTFVANALPNFIKIYKESFQSISQALKSNPISVLDDIT